MCFNIGGGGSYSSAATNASKNENKDTSKVAQKQRLYQTKGKADGEDVTASQSRSIRRLFGN